MRSDIKRRLVGLARDPAEFVSRLRIVDQRGQERTMSHPFAEQVLALGDFMSPAETVVHYKPRQIGDTTVGAAYNFSYLYWVPDPVRCLVVGDSYETTDAIFGKVRHFYRSLPTTLRRPVERSNKRELIFKDTQAGFRCMTAGGRSEARGWTYQRLHADELAFWPNADDVWASVTSTLHEGPHRKVIIMSTADGPGNLFHQKVLAAQEASLMGDDRIRFRFFKWSDHAAYCKKVPSGWEPDQEEYELSQTHDLTMEQLYWRHQKINGVNGIGMTRFRREYPLTIEDGFLVLDGSWFDADYLNDVYSSLSEVEGVSRVYERPIPGMTYAAGVDPSWCNGGDFACMQVLSRDGRLVATLQMNQGGELLFANKAVELAAHYGKCRSLIEHNPGGAGPVVLREFQKAGIPLWTKPAPPGRMPSTQIKYWTTHRGSKQEGYAHLRQMVNGDALTLLDAPTVQELMHIREVGGRIEGQDGYHDDLADALMLAEWNRRTLPGRKMNPRFRKRRYHAQRTPFKTGRVLGQ